MTEDDLTSYCMVILSGLSAISILSIVASYYVLQDIQRKITHQVIYYFAIATFLTSMGSIVGTPPDGSIACWYEGLGTNIFTLSSIAWNLIINYIMYRKIYNKKFSINIYTHLFCWGFPILVSLLPLISTRYGSDIDSWCFIVPLSNTPDWMLTLWTWIAYYAWVWLAFIINILMFIMIRLRIKNYKHQKSKASLLIFVKKLEWYPTIIIFCWILPTFVDVILGNIYPHDRYAGCNIIIKLANIVPCSQGLLSSIVFWVTMKDVRMRWYNLLLGKTTNMNSHNNSRLPSMSFDTRSVIVPVRLTTQLISVQPTSGSNFFTNGNSKWNKIKENYFLSIKSQHQLSPIYSKASMYSEATGVDNRPRLEYNSSQNSFKGKIEDTTSLNRFLDTCEYDMDELFKNNVLYKSNNTNSTYLDSPLDSSRRHHSGKIHITAD